jgi:hypothetical protein
VNDNAMQIVHLVEQEQPHLLLKACGQCGEYARLGDGTHFWTNDRLYYMAPVPPAVSCAVAKWDPGVQVDPRKIGLKNGLRQLASAQIRRVLDYAPEKMALDDGNYVDGKFCPLAVAVGLPEIMKDPTDDRVHAVLTMLGYKVNNTRGIKGKFYTTNRAADLRLAAEEVLREREETT